MPLSTISLWGNLVANQAINKKESGIFSKLYFGGNIKSAITVRSFDIIDWQLKIDLNFGKLKVLKFGFLELYNKSRFQISGRKSQDFQDMKRNRKIELQFFCPPPFS